MHSSKNVGHNLGKVSLLRLSYMNPQTINYSKEGKFYVHIASDFLMMLTFLTT